MQPSPELRHAFIPPTDRNELFGPRALTKGQAPASTLCAGALWAGIFSVSVMAFVLGGCSVLEDYVEQLGETSASANITGVSLVDFSLSGATLAFDVEVNNPYAVALPLLDIGWSVGSGGTELMSGNFEPDQALAAASSTTLTLPASFAFADVLSVLSSIKPGSIVPYELDANLSVDAPLVGRLSLPLANEGELPIPTVPDIELKGIAWDELSMSEARATLRLGIGNTNAFPLSLDTMFYDLALGGTSVASTSVAESVDISEGESAVIEIPISFAPADLGFAVFKMLTGDGAAYALAGTLEVGTPFGPLSLPFDRTGNTPFTR